jgi:Ca-activated chloride channel family protein
MDFSIGNFWYLFLLLLLPVAAILLYNFKKWKLEKQNVFAEAKFQSELFQNDGRFSKIMPLLYFLAVLFLVLAMVDLLSGKKEMKVKQKTSSVIFLLDVSNSMNAQDVQPSRLELAKSLIINSIQNLHDGKVGVVVFAGDAESIMPLTSDYSAADTYLSPLETSIIGRQGTDFLKAVEVAAKKFKDIPKGGRKIILISDGEDNEGNDEAALEEAKKEGITINSVGIGSDEGAPIPVYEFGQLMGYKTDSNNETIITKRQTESLMSMAYETNGEYIDGNNLNASIAKIINILKKKGDAETTVNTQSAIHYYQWFLAIALFLFFFIYFLNPKKDLNV